MRLKHILMSQETLKGKTYFPELQQKSSLQVFLDNIRHFIKYKHTDADNYFLYGLDIKGLRNEDDYLDYASFMARRDFLNNNPSKEEQYSYTGILRDKFYFAIFMESLGFNVPQTYGLVENENVFLLHEKRSISIDEMLKSDLDVIAKPLDGIGGVGIFTLNTSSDGIKMNGTPAAINDVKKEFSKVKFFVQNLIKVQHPDMEKLYPKAINTVRITTVRDLNTGKIELMGCMLLMGARGAVVSNWHYGGVIINIEDNGYLNKYGYSLYEKKITQHPETGVVFETFKVPYFDRCIAEAKRCHELFYGVHSIGWDFAILPDDIMFIEGNDNWGMAAHQMVGGGLAAKFNRYYFKH